MVDTEKVLPDGELFAEGVISKFKRLRLGNLQRHLVPNLFGDLWPIVRRRQVYREAADGGDGEAWDEVVLGKMVGMLA